MVILSYLALKFDGKNQPILPGEQNKLGVTANTPRIFYSPGRIG